jgi:thymidylate synthase ThyX
MQIHVIDGASVPNPEDLAMLQALYSRSFDSVTVHLDKIKATGSGKFMSSYYLGYGHNSIADCGNTLVCFEGVSILGAKVIEDSPLFNGQECSTRYIPFDNAKFIDPLGMFHYQDQWLNIYKKIASDIEDKLVDDFMGEGHSESKSISMARPQAFDIARAFIPAGAQTKVAYYGSLRKLNERLNSWMVHPSFEMKDLAEAALYKLNNEYPNSVKLDTKRQNYSKDNFYTSSNIKEESLVSIQSVFGDYASETPEISREPFQTLPKDYEFKYTIACSTNVDYAGWRDLHRHRNCKVNFPILKATHIHAWYYQSIATHLGLEYAEAVESKVNELLSKICIMEANVDEVELQYYLPIGLVVPYESVMDLNQALYLTELRSGPTVHPTVRQVAQGIGGQLKNYFTQIDIHINTDLTDVEKRSKQTITAKI